MKVKKFWKEAYTYVCKPLVYEEDSQTEPGQAAGIAEMIESFRQGKPVETKQHYYDVVDDTLDDETLASFAPIDEPDELIKAQIYKEQYEVSKENMKVIAGKKARELEEKQNSRKKEDAIQQIQSNRANIQTPESISSNGTE